MGGFFHITSLCDAQARPISIQQLQPGNAAATASIRRADLRHLRAVAAQASLMQICQKRIYPGVHQQWHEKVCLWGMACRNAMQTDEGGMATCDALACVSCHRPHPFQLSICSCGEPYESSMYASDEFDEVEVEEVE